MTTLKNWEFFANTAVAVSGATVTPYVASDIHPNPNSPAAPPTTTDTNGMWSFTALSDANLYDIKVVFGTSTKWYKGNARLALGHLYDDTSPDPNRNLIPNGSFDLTHFLDTNGSQAMPPANPGATVTNAADNWRVYGGTGDTGTISKESTQKPANSQVSLKIAYTRAGGQCTVAQNIPSPTFQQLRGKTVSFSVQVYQESTSAELQAYLLDGVTVGQSGPTSVVGSWTTLSVTNFPVAAAAAFLVVIVQTSMTATGARVFYVDNAALDLGSVAPVYAPDLYETTPTTLFETITDTAAPALAASGNVNTLAVLLDNLANRVKAITGGADWRAAPAATITGLITSLATKVNKSGDTMTGVLTFTNTHQGITLSGGSQVRDGLLVQLEMLAQQGNVMVLDGRDSSELFYVNKDAQVIRFRGNPLFHAGMDGSGSGIDADLVDGLHAAAFALSGHTHAVGPTVPTGLGAWVPTVAEIPPGWSRYAAANGRILVGSGTSSVAGITFADGPNGTNWQHGHSDAGHGHTDSGHGHGDSGHNHSGSSLGVGGNTSGPTGTGTYGGTGATAADGSHFHGSGSLDVTGNTANASASISSGTANIGTGSASISLSTWAFPTQAVIWIRKD